MRQLSSYLSYRQLNTSAAVQIRQVKEIASEAEMEGGGSERLKNKWEKKQPHNAHVPSMWSRVRFACTRKSLWKLYAPSFITATVCTSVLCVLCVHIMRYVSHTYFRMNACRNPCKCDAAYARCVPQPTDSHAFCFWCSGSNALGIMARERALRHRPNRDVIYAHTQCQ